MGIWLSPSQRNNGWDMTHIIWLYSYDKLFRAFTIHFHPVADDGRVE